MQENDITVTEETPESNEKTLTARLEEQAAAITGLEAALAERDAEIASLRGTAEQGRADAEKAGADRAAAVEAYRQLLAETNPALPGDLISGGSIDEVNESVRMARELAERVRKEVEAEIARTRVPAGAPQRTAQDTSALSAREKIQYGVSRGAH